MSNPLTIELHASGAESSSGSGTAVDGTLDAAGASAYPRGGAKLTLEVSAISGTDPTLDVVVESSPNQTGPWEQAAAFAQKIATGVEHLSVAGLDRWIRVRWTLGGTGGPVATFKVSGTAETILAQPSDLLLPADALDSIGAAQKAKHLLHATGKVLSYVAAAHKMPLTTWGDDLRDATAMTATVELLDEVGWRPTTDFDQRLGSRYIYLYGNPDIGGSKGWLDLVAEGKVTPDGLVDATPDTDETGVFVQSGTKRGW